MARRKTKHLISVHWKDAASVDAWTNAEHIEHACSDIVTVGMLVAETDDTVTVALNHDETSDSYSCFIHIPAAWIQKRKRLR